MNKMMFLLLICTSTQVQAQLAQRLVSEFKKLKNISYSQTARSKDFFSENILTDTLDAKITLKPELAFDLKGNKQQDIYDGNKLFRLNLTDSTYRISSTFEQAAYYYQSLPYLISLLEKNLKKGARATQLKDSIYEGKKYLQLRVKELDSIKAEKRISSYTTYLIDKKTFLPHYYRNDSQGFIDGTNIYLTIFNEYHFSRFQANISDLSSGLTTILPSYFNLEKPKKPKPLLAKGTVAPDLQLIDINGQTLQLPAKSGKITLLNFTVNGCPHCVAAIDMLNMLHSTFKNHNFQLISINLFDDHASIKKFNEKFKVNYPVYTTTKETPSKFNVEGYPVFYIINQAGEIVTGYSGYTQRMDEELSGIIRSLTNTKN